MDDAVLSAVAEPAQAMADVPFGESLLADYSRLGASLYIPAARSDLMKLMNQERLPGLRSMVVCTEDAVAEHDLPQALDNLAHALRTLGQGQTLRFVRPRNLDVLAHLLTMEGAERLTGVVLPKADEGNLHRYLDLVSRMPGWCVMPTLETDLAFSRARLERFASLLTESPVRVLCLRIGGNDLLQLLGLKRPKHMTVYDTPLRTVINDLIITFRPAGFELSAPVFEHLDSWRTLRRELELDLVHGLWTKTVIHPTQVSVVESHYPVSAADYAIAGDVLAEHAPAVSRRFGQMVEPATHMRWARRIMARAAVYGVAS